MQEYANLVSDVEKAPRIILNQRGEYLFNAFSIGERGTRLPYPLVDEVLKGLVQKIIPFGSSFHYIVSVVPAGSQWGLLVAHKLQKPLAMVIDHTTGLPDEIRVHQTNPIYDRDLFFSGFEAGDRVILLDDVISTGETARLVVNTLRESFKVKVIAIFCIITKGSKYKEIHKSEKIPVHSLINLTQDGQIIPKKR